MKKSLLNLSVGIAAMAFSTNVNAQCPQITCPSDITVDNNLGTCAALVNYSTPVGTDLCTTTSQTFTYTGAEETWIVPAGVTSITVDAFGAQGGSNDPVNINYGGHVQADYPVTPGTTIYIYVGEQPAGLTGGWNGGGDGETAGAGGGGASDIRIGGNTLNDRVIVAGGAGGAGFWSGDHVFGGLGGGLVGGDGYRNTTATPGGDGGTQTASGNGTCVSLDNPSVTGGFGFGGAPTGCGCEGYGGGSGWYGGAGSGNCRGGGGGSSYTEFSATNVTHNQGVRMGNGEIIITWSPLPTTALTAGMADGATFPVGITTNTYEVTSGTSTSSCSFTVTVIDTMKPTITSPANRTFCEGVTANDIAPVSSSDNCGGEVITYDLTGATTGSGNDDASGTVFNLGLTTVTYTATDAEGNQESSSFEIQVNPCGVGVDENSIFSDAVVYPNPTNDVVNILLNEGSTNVSYEVFSIEGKRILSKKNINDNKISIDLGKEENGVYYLQMEESGSTRTFKILKQ